MQHGFAVMCLVLASIASLPHTSTLGIDGLYRKFWQNHAKLKRNPAPHRQDDGGGD